MLRTYANSYLSSSQTCSTNLLKVAQVYRNNYCFPTSIQGSAYKSFSTSGSSALVNSYIAAGCTGIKTNVTVYGFCNSYKVSTTLSSALYLAQYWYLLYYNAPPTFKPTTRPTSIQPTRAPTTRKPTYAPSTRRPSNALTGYAYFNSYSGSECTGKVVAITAYPIGICIPQYNTSSIESYVYYDCDQSKLIWLEPCDYYYVFAYLHSFYVVAVITATYFEDSSCALNISSPEYFPIANSSCTYSILNLTTAAFCNSSVPQVTDLIPRTLGSSWNINVLVNILSKLQNCTFMRYLLAGRMLLP